MLVSEPASRSTDGYLVNSATARMGCLDFSGRTIAGEIMLKDFWALRMLVCGILSGPDVCSRSWRSGTVGREAAEGLSIPARGMDIRTPGGLAGRRGLSAWLSSCAGNCRCF